MGLYDMTGNVWEWCWNNTNESNPLKKTKHNISEIGILKGCAWSSSPGDCLVSTSIPNDPTIQNSSIGFRLAKN
jgi:formylglycine-generating enzyme required for sulfatase activity